MFLQTFWHFSQFRGSSVNENVDEDYVVGFSQIEKKYRKNIQEFAFSKDEDSSKQPKETHKPVDYLVKPKAIEEIHFDKILKLRTDSYPTNKAGQLIENKLTVPNSTKHHFQSLK